jgi:hypothetical protein
MNLSNSQLATIKHAIRVLTVEGEISPLELHDNGQFAKEILEAVVRSVEDPRKNVIIEVQEGN